MVEMQDSHSDHDATPRVARSLQETSVSDSSRGVFEPSNIFIPAPPLANSRYNRQLLIPSIGLSGQKLISNAKVLIIGLGGLGSPASLYLAGAGVHTLGLLDHDVVETSNLHRQIVHRESSVLASGGQSLTKVASALRGCRELNSSITCETYEVQLSGGNALDIIAKYDVVLDCTDNPATRYLISDCCVVLGKTLVSGAAQRLEGQVIVLNNPMKAEGEKSSATVNGHEDNGDIEVTRGPCYRCVFPVPPSPEMVKGCSEIGILGPVVGAIGTLMASEALRLICRPGEVRKPTMLLYNAWSADPRGMFRSIGLRGRRPDCLACGDAETMKGKNQAKIDAGSITDGRMDYNTFCGRVEDVNLLGEKDRVSAEAFMQALSRNIDEKPIIVDVREEYEIELGPKLQGSINIPISKCHQNIMSNTTDEHELVKVLHHSEKAPVYFVCQRGNDSQIAAQKLIELEKLRNGKNGASDEPKRWIGDVKGGFMALEKLSLND